MARANQQVTEEAILTAAQQIFITNGYAGTNLQHIADAAGTNRTLIHYYFRSKQHLFDRVFQEILTTVMAPLASILNKPEPLNEKIKRFVNQYIDTLKENPHIPTFMLHELSANKPLILKFFQHGIKGKVKAFMDQLAEHSDLDARQLFINFISMLVFPFIGRDLFTELFDMSSSEYNDFLEHRKKMLYNYITSQLK